MLQYYVTRCYFMFSESKLAKLWSNTKSKRINNSANNKTQRLLKEFYKAARIIHIYISMVLLGLMAFFCLTGIFLNHNDWFEKSYSEHVVPLVVNAKLANALANTQSLADAPTAELQDYMTKQYRLTKLNQINFDSDTRELVLDYQLPAGYATAYFTQQGDATLEYRKGSIVTVMNDLHKGRHSGPVWSWVIDLSAAFMLVFSIAGLIILIQNKKHRTMGLVLGALGIAFPIIIYVLWVPLISGV